MTTNRERLNAILHYKPYDRMPIMHFGFWLETLEKWVSEGHISDEEMHQIRSSEIKIMDGTEGETKIAGRLGFCDNYFNYAGQRES